MRNYIKVLNQLSRTYRYRVGSVPLLAARVNIIYHLALYVSVLSLTPY